MDLQQVTAYVVLKSSLCNNFELCNNTFITFKKNMNAIIIEHIIKKLFMNLLMMWCLCWIYQGWHKVVSESLNDML